MLPPRDERPPMPLVAFLIEFAKIEDPDAYIARELETWQMAL